MKGDTREWDFVTIQGGGREVAVATMVGKWVSEMEVTAPWTVDGDGGRRDGGRDGDEERENRIFNFLFIIEARVDF